MSLYGFGGRSLKIRDICMDFWLLSPQLELSLFNLKASNLDKWPISMLSFMWWCQFIDWFKVETHPSSLPNSRLAYTTGILKNKSHQSATCTPKWFTPSWEKVEVGELMRKGVHGDSYQNGCASNFIRFWTYLESLTVLWFHSKGSSFSMVIFKALSIFLAKFKPTASCNEVCSANWANLQ